MYILNEKLSNLKPYEPISGKYRIRLDANESFLKPSKSVSEKIYKKIEEVGFNRYPDSLSDELCTAFSSCYGVEKDAVTAFNGSDESIYVILNSFLEAGDKVVTLTPDFSMYKIYASTAEAKVLEYEKDENFGIDIKKLISFINENSAKLVIFSNPCNPTSVGFKKDDIRKLIRSVDALVVLDEAYMDFWDQSLLEEALDFDNLIILKTCSKALGMAAARIGFTICNENLTSALRAAKSPYNVNSLSAAAGSVILSEPDYLKDCTRKILLSLSQLYDGLSKNPNLSVTKPDTNFVSVKTDKAPEIFEFLKNNGIIVRCFGDRLRITAGTDSENIEVIKEIGRFFDENR